MHTQPGVRVLWVWAMAGLLTLMPVTAAAQTTVANDPRTPSTASRLMSREEVATFADGFFEDKIGVYVPGATLAVVKDGAVLFAKGYGYANLERKTPVNVDTTIFHTASVSKKLFEKVKGE